MVHYYIKRHAQRVRLKREIDLWEAVLYGVGVIIGAGIYALVGKAAGIAGNGLWLSFILAAVVASLTGLGYAELSSFIPKSSAEYSYTRRAFRSKLVSFSLAFLIIFVGSVSAAAVSLGFGGYLQNMLGTPLVLNATALIIILSIINFYGIDTSVKFNAFLTMLTVFGLLVIIFLGIPYFGSVNYFDLSFGFSGVMAAAAFIFFAYLGFEDIANIAEETKQPRKTLPKATLIVIVLTSLLYILVSLSAISVVPWQELAESTAPLADVAERALPGSSPLLSIIALFATASTVFIFLIAYSRMIYGMTEEHSLPEIFSSLHPTTRTPWAAIIFLMFAALAFVFIGDIKFVASIADFGSFFIFAVVNLSLIWLRFTDNSHREFRVPLNIGKFPVLTFFGLLTCLIMLTQFDFSIISFGTIILIAGAVVYKFLEEINSIVMSTTAWLKRILWKKAE